MASVIERGIKAGEFRPVNVMVAAKLAMSPVMHAVIARKAFSACMPEGFDVGVYLNTTSISISMASLNRSLVVALVMAGAAPLTAQVPAPLRLSFADAVRQATGQTQEAPPSVTIAGFRADAAAARVRQVRSGLLPDLSLHGFLGEPLVQFQDIGISFPGPVVIPTRIGPFSAYDGRARSRRRSSISRISAGSARPKAGPCRYRGALGGRRSQRAECGTRVRARGAGTGRGHRARRRLGARRGARRSRVAQQKAGVSASIDVTRARTQLAEAAGQLVVAENQLDSRQDRPRPWARPRSEHADRADRHLTAQLGAADVPVDHDARRGASRRGAPRSRSRDRARRSGSHGGVRDLRGAAARLDLERTMG